MEEEREGEGGEGEREGGKGERERETERKRERERDREKKRDRDRDREKRRDRETEREIIHISHIFVVVFYGSVFTQFYNIMETTYSHFLGSLREGRGKHTQRKNLMR